MLALDAYELRKLVFRICDHEASGVLGLGLPPFVCFFAVEAYDWIRRQEFAEADQFLEANAARVRRLRAQVKGLDERGGLEDAFQRLDTLQRTSSRLFPVDGSGVIGFFRRWFGTDLGLYYSGSDLVATTHVALANLGYAEEGPKALDHTMVQSIGEEAAIFAESLGRFIAERFDIRERMAMPDEDPLPEFGVVTAEDHKAAEAYRRLAERLGTENRSFAVAITWLVAQVNYVHRAMPCFLPANSELSFRFRFLTVFHTAVALRALGAITRGDTSSELGRLIAELQSRPGLRRVRSLKGLRNRIAHYDARGLEGSHISVRYLDALVMSLANVHRSELSDHLDQELAAISTRCRSLLKKGSLGGRTVRL